MRERLFFFDSFGDPISPELAATLDSESPLARPARSGFLAGMFVTWFGGGKATAAQTEALLGLARETCERAAAIFQQH